MKHLARTWFPKVFIPLVAASLTLVTSTATADAVTDWAKQSVGFVVAAKKPPGFGQIVMAMNNTAVYAAVNAITKTHQPGLVSVNASDGASLDAAIAAASHATLSKFMPKQQAAIDAAYQATIDQVKDEKSRDAGVAVGKAASAATFKYRKSLKKPVPMFYRPITTPGVYIPTPQMAGVAKGKLGPATWPTWILDNPAALAPPPPVALDSETWARDYNEVKALGGKDSKDRTDAQTQMALFWEDTQPSFFYGIVLSVANRDGRDITQNARLLAAAGQAMNDGIAAVFEAKYRYHLWRPITAIRNGDQDGNDATERDPSWTPLIKTPMHPEYPCAHCVVAASAAGVLVAELNGEAVPVQTTSLKLPGVTREFDGPDAFAKEAIEARIFDGVHYRTSGEVGYEMGMRLGKMAMDKFMQK